MQTNLYDLFSHRFYNESYQDTGDTIKRIWAKGWITDKDALDSINKLIERDKDHQIQDGIKETN